ncbi:MAG: hypothetical protein SF070_11450 [Gemmatimonadota bacterium]|nr:hypothetical protein [Gemmatimonadota bacterium]
MIRRIGICVAALGLAACDASNGTVCTEEFRTLAVTLVESGGQPVNDATTVTVVPRTGDTLPVTWLGTPVAGTYVYLDDGAKPRIRELGDSLRVDVDRSAGADFSIAFFVDVPGGCHVNKVSGPDSVVVP